MLNNEAERSLINMLDLVHLIFTKSRVHKQHVGVSWGVIWGLFLGWVQWLPELPIFASCFPNHVLFNGDILEWYWYWFFKNKIRIFVDIFQNVTTHFLKCYVFTCVTVYKILKVYIFIICTTLFCFYSENLHFQFFFPLKCPSHHNNTLRGMIQYLCWMFARLWHITFIYSGHILLALDFK